jgi:hypothetical protein
MLGQNHFAEPNRHALTSHHPKFAVDCTGGVALMWSIDLSAFCCLISAASCSKMFEHLSIVILCMIAG